MYTLFGMSPPMIGTAGYVILPRIRVIGIFGQFALEAVTLRFRIGLLLNVITDYSVALYNAPQFLPQDTSGRGRVSQRWCRERLFGI